MSQGSIMCGPEGNFVSKIAAFRDNPDRTYLVRLAAPAEIVHLQEHNGLDTAALSGARRADVTDFGVPEHHGSAPISTSTSG